MERNDAITGHYVEWKGHWYGVPEAWTNNLERAGFAVVQEPANIAIASESEANKSTEE